MRKFFLRALCAALSLTLALGVARAEEQTVDMTKWITLTVKQGEEIILSFAASAGDVWVKVTGVEGEKIEKAPTQLPWEQLKYKATGTEIKVFGAIDQFSCSNNDELLTAINVSANPQLTELNCSSNQLTTLDVNKNVNLTKLDCSRNQLTTLDVSKNVNLTDLSCVANQLLTLDVSRNVKLTNLSCAVNQLSTLDMSMNSQLKTLYVYDNNFSTTTLNALYCSLPDRQGKARGELFVSRGRRILLTKLVRSTSKAITDSKNWAIKDFSYKDIKDITGNFSCGATYALTLSPAYREGKFPCEGGEWQVTVASTGAWKLDESEFSVAGWLRVWPKNGENGTVVKITVSPNNDKTKERAFPLAFMLTDGSNTKQVVTVGQHRASLSVTPIDDYTLPAAGETKAAYFSVRSTGKWKVASSNAAWNVLDKSEGAAGETKLTLQTGVNPSTAERSTKLTFALVGAEEVKQEVTVKQAGSSIMVTPAEEVALPAVGETKENYFTVTSTSAWKVTSSNAEWNVLDKTEGAAGETKVTLKAEMNPSTAERSTKLTFALVGAEEVKQEVTVKQAGSSITVTPAEEVMLPAAGETKAEYFTVKSTSAWKVTSSNAAWNVLDKTEGAAGETKLTLQTGVNPSTAERSTKLTFALVGAEEVKQEVTVKQAGSSITVTPAEEVALPAAGETKENYFTVTSTSAWKVTSSNAAWNVLDETEGAAGETKVTLKTEMNPSTAERSTKLTFALVGAEEVKQEVTVKQAGSSITVTPAEEVAFPAAGETKAEYFTVKSTGAWKVTSSNAAWNVLDKTEGEKGETKLTLQTGVNPSTAERSTKLTFALVGAEEVKQEVTVKQAGSSITVTPAEEVTLPAAGETKAEYFTVKSTSAWKVTSSNAAWNVLDKTEGAAGDTKVTLKAEMNPSTAERSTKLTFALVGAEELKQEVTVKQAGKSTPPNPSTPSDPSKPSTPLAVESAPLASIVVAPNPFSAQLQIINDALVEGEYELLTASGVVVRSGALQGRETVLNTVELRAGGYLLRLLVGKEQKTIFVVKE